MDTPTDQLDPRPSPLGFRRACKRYAQAVLALACGGALLGLGSSSLRDAELKAGLCRPVPNIDRKDALSQNLAIFVLGGLRSLAAELYCLGSVSAWMDRDWPLVESRWENATTLAPNRINYWIWASSDMAINAESDVRNNRRLSKAERLAMSKHYFERGVRFLEDAIANNPDEPELYFRLGDLYSDLFRFPQFAKAAEAYHKAFELGGGMRSARWEFFCLCRIRGREREAYDLGRWLFQYGENRVETVRSLLFVLQNRLDLPEHERLGIEELFGSEEAALELMEEFHQNTLRLPSDGMKAYLDAHRHKDAEPETLPENKG